jgi:hypothetical protein
MVALKHQQRVPNSPVCAGTQALSAPHSGHRVLRFGSMGISGPPMDGGKPRA